MVGGRLIIPLGGAPRQQTLIKITPRREREYQKENLGAVAFVPLIGEPSGEDRGV